MIYEQNIQKAGRASYELQQQIDSLVDPQQHNISQQISAWQQQMDAHDRNRIPHQGKETSRAAE